MNVTTQDSSYDEFEFIASNENLITIKKEWHTDFAHNIVVYVFDNAEEIFEPSYGIFCEFTDSGSSYWKETYNG